MPVITTLPEHTINSPGGIPSLDEFLAYIKVNNLARQERFFVKFPMMPLPDVLMLKNKELMLLCHQASIPGKNISTRNLRINGLDRQFAHTADYGSEITLEFLMDTDFTPRAVFETWMNRCVSHYEVSDSNEVGWYNDYVSHIELNALVPAGIPGEALFNWSPTQADLGLRKKLDTSAIKNSALKGTVNTALDKVFGRGKRLVDNTFNKIKAGAVGAVNGITAPLLELATDAEQVAYKVVLVDAWPKSIQVSPLGWDAIGVQKMTVTFVYHHWISGFGNPEMSGSNILGGSKPVFDENGNLKVDADGNPAILNTGINGRMREALGKYANKIPATNVGQLGNDLKKKASNLFRRG